MFSKKVSVIFLSIILFLFSGCKNDPTTANTDVSSLLEKADLLMLDGKYEEAILNYETILEIEPRHTDVYLKLAQAYERQGNLVSGASILRDGVRQRVPDAEILAKQAYLYTYRMKQETSATIAWKEIFNTFLAEQIPLWLTEDDESPYLCGFRVNLVDVDFDDVPEILLSRPTGNDSLDDNISLYAIKDNSVVLIGDVLCSATAIEYPFFPDFPTAPSTTAGLHLFRNLTTHDLVYTFLSNWGKPSTCGSAIAELGSLFETGSRFDFHLNYNDSSGVFDCYNQDTPVSVNDYSAALEEYQRNIELINFTSYELGYSESYPHLNAGNGTELASAVLSNRSDTAKVLISEFLDGYTPFDLKGYTEGRHLTEQDILYMRSYAGAALMFHQETGSFPLGNMSKRELMTFISCYTSNQRFFFQDTSGSDFYYQQNDISYYGKGPLVWNAQYEDNWDVSLSIDAGDLDDFLYGVLGQHLPDLSENFTSSSGYNGEMNNGVYYTSEGHLGEGLGSAWLAKTEFLSNNTFKADFFIMWDMENTTEIVDYLSNNPEITLTFQRVDMPCRFRILSFTRNYHISEILPQLEELFGVWVP